MPLDEREVVRRAMQALSMRTVIIHRSDSERETAYEDGELVEFTTEDAYALCAPNDDGSWECTRYTMRVELEPMFEATSSREAVERCVKEFSIDRVLVLGKDSWGWYENGEWLETFPENVIATAEELSHDEYHDYDEEVSELPALQDIMGSLTVEQIERLEAVDCLLNPLASLSLIQGDRSQTKTEKGATECWLDIFER